MSDDPSDQFIDAVQPKACRVISLPTRLWVLGGPAPTDSHEPPRSLRASFWRQAFNGVSRWSWLQSLDRPENYPGWWTFTGYRDLLKFERDACYLARGALLFAESPGAYAELGALALDTAILPRLMVVVAARHLAEEDSQSLLYLGPLKRVNEHEGQYIIDSAAGPEISDMNLGAIMRFVDGKLPRIANSSALDATNPMHRLLLLADLIDMFLVSGLHVSHRAPARLGRKGRRPTARTVSPSMGQECPYHARSCWRAPRPPRFWGGDRGGASAMSLA